jgi:hypothetical protein
MVSKGELNDILEGTGWKAKEFIDSDHSSYICVMEKALKYP